MPSIFSDWYQKQNFRRITYQDGSHSWYPVDVAIVNGRVYRFLHVADEFLIGRIGLPKDGRHWLLCNADMSKITFCIPNIRQERYYAALGVVRQEAAVAVLVALAWGATVAEDIPIKAVVWDHKDENPHHNDPKNLNGEITGINVSKGQTHRHVVRAEPSNTTVEVYKATSPIDQLNGLYEMDKPGLYVDIYDQQQKLRWIPKKKQWQLVTVTPEGETLHCISDQVGSGGVPCIPFKKNVFKLFRPTKPSEQAWVRVASNDLVAARKAEKKEQDELRKESWTLYDPKKVPLTDLDSGRETLKPMENRAIREWKTGDNDVELAQVPKKGPSSLSPNSQKNRTRELWRVYDKQKNDCAKKIAQGGVLGDVAKKKLDESRERWGKSGGKAPKPVYQLERGTRKKLKRHDSIAAAATAVKGDPSNIVKAANDERKTSAGFE